MIISFLPLPAPLPGGTFMSTMIQPIKNKFGVYTLRMAVPSELRITLGKSEIKRSLKTKELAVAKLNAPAVIAEMQAMLQQARGTLQPEQSVRNRRKNRTQGI